ncbi:DUF4262 domain-containing protein [Actinoplanes aureus]|uniref:DUF4262 domain-containing protein n=1 Tax=Actinoplanes aureus TaxID=2792083 RepID=A0A931C6R8_9ACTN|nr:DUF4262 domain-containing protein [Actinoplanes aureus]MBG0563239.1 DUF4262 domain-containing protein [Actinoplanes aureus]
MSFRDDFFERQSEIIDEYGWAVVHVLPADDDPEETVPFAYTVGLTGFGFPELAITGLDPEAGHQILNELACRLCDDGLRLSHGQRISDLLADQEVVIVAGEATEEVFPGAALARYGDERVHLRQIVWPDLDNRYPWQRGYESLLYPQPTIGAPAPAAAARCRGFRGIPHAHGRRRPSSWSRREGS